MEGSEKHTVIFYTFEGDTDELFCIPTWLYSIPHSCILNEHTNKLDHILFIKHSRELIHISGYII